MQTKIKINFSSQILDTKKMLEKNYNKSQDVKTPMKRKANPVNDVTDGTDLEINSEMPKSNIETPKSTYSFLKKLKLFPKTNDKTDNVSPTLSNS